MSQRDQIEGQIADDPLWAANEILHLRAVIKVLDKRCGRLEAEIEQLRAFGHGTVRR